MTRDAPVIAAVQSHEVHPVIFIVPAAVDLIGSHTGHPVRICRQYNSQILFGITGSQFIRFYNVAKSRVYISVSSCHALDAHRYFLLSDLRHDLAVHSAIFFRARSCRGEGQTVCLSVLVRRIHSLLRRIRDAPCSGQNDFTALCRDDLCIAGLYHSLQCLSIGAGENRCRLDVRLCLLRCKGDAFHISLISRCILRRCIQVIGRIGAKSCKCKGKQDSRLLCRHRLRHTALLALQSCKTLARTISKNIRRGKHIVTGCRLVHAELHCRGGILQLLHAGGRRQFCLRTGMIHNDTV